LGGGVIDQPENTSEYWRVKAQQARALAPSLKDAHAQVHILAAAESYGRLAEIAEKRSANKNAPDSELSANRNEADSQHKTA